MAEKSIHGSNEAPESKSEHDSESSDSGDDQDMIDGFAEELRKKKLDELNRNAFYSVLLAFRSETSKIGKKRAEMIENLMKEWDIAHETRVSFEDNINKNLTAQRQRIGSDVKETQIAEAKPLTISEKKPTLFSTCDATPRSSWGRPSDGKETEKVTAVEEQKGQPLKVNEKDQESFIVAPAKIQEEKAEPSSTTPKDSLIPSWGDVSPASLIKKWVNIRISSENDYVAFLIADYHAETEMHQLVTSPSKKELEDPCDWIDIRYFTPEEIVWQEGHPGIPIHKRSLKPGETILHATTTAREKKQVKEVRNVIMKLDKGKSIA